MLDPQLLQVTVINIVAAPLGNRVQLNTVGELHGFTCEVFTISALALLAQRSIALMSVSVGPQEKRSKLYRSLLLDCGFQVRTASRRRAQLEDSRNEVRSTEVPRPKTMRKGNDRQHRIWAEEW